VREHAILATREHSPQDVRLQLLLARHDGAISGRGGVVEPLQPTAGRVLAEVEIGMTAL